MIGSEIRRLLAEVTSAATVADLDADTPLLSGGLGLNSITAVRLMRAIRERFGVDIVAEDTNLDALASIRTLVNCVADRVGSEYWADRGDDIALCAAASNTTKTLYVADGRLDGDELVGDLDTVTSTCVAAVRAAGGHILKESHVVFPNGAITLVLILAESHLSVHTWPEEKLATIDLFSCGAIDGRAVVERLISSFGMRDARVRQTPRGLDD